MSVPAPIRPPARGSSPRVMLIVAGFAVVALLIGLAVLLVPGPARGSDDAAAVPGPAPAPAVTEDSAQEAPGAITVEEVPAPEGSSASLGGLAGDVIETPCFTFEAPMLLQNVSTAQETAACAVDAVATVRATLDGQTSESLWGQVDVVSVVLDDGPAPDSRTAFDAVWATYAADRSQLPDVSPEVMTLDGAPAEIIRFASADGALDIAVLVAYPPHAYWVDGGESQLVVVTFAAQAGSGDDYIERVTATWGWT